MSEPGPVSSSGTPADDDVCPRCNGRGREMNAEVQIGAPSCLACFGTGKKENPIVLSNECSDPDPNGGAPCCRPLGHHVLTEHWNGTDSWPHQPGPTSPSGTPADERRGRAESMARALRAIDLDPDEFCTTTPGRLSVQITRNEAVR